MEMLPLIIQAISGLVGGNAAGVLLKEKSLGTMLNSIVGLIGGGGTGALLSMFGAGFVSDGDMNLANIISSVAGGGASGAVLTGIIGMVKGMMGGK